MAYVSSGTCHSSANSSMSQSFGLRMKMLEAARSVAFVRNCVRLREVAAVIREVYHVSFSSDAFVFEWALDVAVNERQHRCRLSIPRSSRFSTHAS